MSEETEMKNYPVKLFLRFFLELAYRIMQLNNCSHYPRKQAALARGRPPVNKARLARGAFKANSC